MKKVVGFLGVIGLGLLLVVGTPFHTSAAPSTQDSEEEVFAQSRQITDYRVTFKNVDVPPLYQKYSVGGWTGTLTRVRYQNTGTEIIAYYSGTVYCSGSCAMNKDLGTE